MPKRGGQCGQNLQTNLIFFCQQTTGTVAHKNTLAWSLSAHKPTSIHFMNLSCPGWQVAHWSISSFELACYSISVALDLQCSALLLECPQGSNVLLNTLQVSSMPLHLAYMSMRVFPTHLTHLTQNFFKLLYDLVMCIYTLFKCHYTSRCIDTPTKLMTRSVSPPSCCICHARDPMPFALPHFSHVPITWQSKTPHCMRGSCHPPQMLL